MWRWGDFYIYITEEEKKELESSEKVGVWEQSIKSIKFEINLSFQSNSYFHHSIKTFIKLMG